MMNVCFHAVAAPGIASYVVACYSKAAVRSSVHIAHVRCRSRVSRTVLACEANPGCLRSVYPFEEEWHTIHAPGRGLALHQVEAVTPFHAAIIRVEHPSAPAAGQRQNSVVPKESMRAPAKPAGEGSPLLSPARTADPEAPPALDYTAPTDADFVRAVPAPAALPRGRRRTRSCAVCAAAF